MLQTRKSFFATCLATMVFTTVAWSASAFADVRLEINKLLSVVEQLAQGAEDQRDGYCQERTIRLAYYKVRQTIWNLDDYRADRSAISALEVAAEKLNDRYLGQQEKLFWALDCIGVALRKLIPQHFYGTAAARKLLQAANGLGDGYVFDGSVEMLRLAKQTLRNMCPITYRRAIEAIDVAIEKATDTFLDDNEKAFYVDDCIKVALRNL